jgi:hypothetical protein
MPATLSEAFGDNYETYPPTENNQMKKRKKPAKNKVAEYGHTIPQKKYLSSEPERTLNISSVDDDFDAQYLEINNNSEFGPTDYNIKPKDIQEYSSQFNQMQQDFHPNNINDATNYIIDQNSVFRNQQQTPQLPQYQPSQSQQSQKASQSKQEKLPQDDPRIQEFNAKLDLILQKLGKFDEPAQENIHDIILFVIFGVFVIFILDSVYRVGKMSI